MEKIGLEVQRREKVGKEAVKKMRREGYIPAVLYGPSIETTPLTIKAVDLSMVLDTGSRESILIDLKIKGDKGAPVKKTVIMREVQKDPVKRNVVHVDLFEVLMDKIVRVSVPVHVVGVANGVEMGGILQHETRELSIECLPSSFPDSIDVDVTELEIGDSLHVRDLKREEGIKILEDDALTIVSIVTPAKEIEVKTAEEMEEEITESFGEGEEKAAEAEEAEEKE